MEWLHTFVGRGCFPLLAFCFTVGLAFQCSSTSSQTIDPAPSGWVTLTYSNGDRFAGNLEKGVKEGKGIYTYSNGDRFEGLYVKGLRHGSGVYLYANGDQFVGLYAFGQREGEGLYSSAEYGYLLSGTWKQNKLQGQVSIKNQKGSLVWTGVYEDGNFKLPWLAPLTSSKDRVETSDP